MARKCFNCGKGMMVGRNVSHANNRSRKVSFPNLQSTRVKIDGQVKRVNLCTRCIRSAALQKAVG